MAPRANWKGHLKLGLISCPVALYPASSRSERVSFHKVSKETGRRLKQQYVDSVSGDVVESWQQAKGYEIAKNEFLTVNDEELDSIKLESSKIIGIDKFVRAETIDYRYYDSPYFIVPTDKVGQDAFAVIRDGMNEKKVVAIATVVISRRERTLMLMAYGKGIMGITLRFPYEVRDSEVYFEDIPPIHVPDEIHALGVKLIEMMTTNVFEPKEMVDRYEDAIVDLIRKKKMGYSPAGPDQEEERKPPKFSVSIKELLKLTLQNAKAEEKKEPKPARKRSKKTA